MSEEELKMERTKKTTDERGGADGEDEAEYTDDPGKEGYDFGYDV